MFGKVKNFLGFGPPGEVYDNEVAPYTVIKQFDGYDLREYPAQKWVATAAVTTATAGDLKKDNSSMFWKLFGYISGKNAAESKISMTVPVMISHVKEDVGDQTESAAMKREMAFFIPTEFQESPPDPAEPDVRIMAREPLLVYSKMMGGFPDFPKEAEKFRAELEQGGHTDVDFSMFYSAGYDSPFKWLNRRNEVMFKKIGEIKSDNEVKSDIEVKSDTEVKSDDEVKADIEVKSDDEVKADKEVTH